LVNLNDRYLCCWLAFNNIDPVRDCRIIHRKLSPASLFVDATVKTFDTHHFQRPWPNIVVSSLNTIKKIDENWNCYFNEKLILSPSLNYQLLNKDSGAVAAENKS
jgi:4-hydroxy-3-polyprenylbenzoate decarboxylase